MVPSDSAPREVLSFLAKLDEVDLARFRVVGTYTRYDERLRHGLQDARQKILAGFERPGRRRENHLIWAAPGSGKTYFVQQIAATLPHGISFCELNLAKCAEPEFRSGLGALDTMGTCLCLVDEVDAQPQASWPYEVLLPYLDAAVERGTRLAFVLAGSSGTCLREFKERIAARPKGPDLLSRIPPGHEYEIGPMSVGDRLLIVLSQLRQAGEECGRDIQAVERLGLYYVALNSRLVNARQLREFAVQAVERVPVTDDRVKYDHLFLPGDPENKAFWVQALPVAEHLVNTFVTIRAGRSALVLPGATASSGAPAAVTSRTASTPTGTPARTNLARQLTSFIGREQEIAEVKRLLPTTGLLTLTGSGGCGKTRLALQTAAALVSQYRDGVWVAELAALSDPALVPKTVAAALDVPEQPGRALTDTLRDHLRPKSLLLILDCCEHLVSACAQLAETLLGACPGLRILATSREPLGVPGEVIWRVPSLSVPDITHRASVDQLMRCEAVRLFVDRAALSQPGFHLTGDKAAMVAQVARRLDGIPLAIELAAARAKALPLEAIAGRLDDQFRLLAGGSRTRLPRHQTLRATLDWSYGLLSEPERVLLRRLSIFAGGFTVDAAEKICAGKGVDEADVMDLLTNLVDRSLVIFDERDGRARYRLLESVRQYGRDKSRESGETGSLGRRHRGWYLALAEQAEPELRGPRQISWLERLETEHDNLRVALEWSLTEADGATAGLRLASALFWFWYVHGDWSEGRGWLEKVLERSSEAPSSIMPKALQAAAFLARRQGDYERVTPLVERGLALSRELGDKGYTAWFLVHYGLAALNAGGYDRAGEFFEEALTLCRESGDKWFIALGLHHVGHVARAQGKLEQAMTLYMEALATWREVGDTAGIAHGLQLIGTLWLLRGEVDKAASSYAQVLAEQPRWIGKREATESIAGLAQVASARGRHERAARLFGSAEALREALGLRGLAMDQARHGEALASTRAKLGDTIFDAARAEGRAMTLEQAVAHALSETD